MVVILQEDLLYLIENDLNQLTKTSAHIYTYDADGNMNEEKNIATTETKKFYYNSENRMIKYEHYPTDLEPANIIAEYKYDIYGRRLQKNVNGVITNFFWEGDNMSFELNANYQPIRRYIYENGMDDVQGHVEYSEVTDPEYFSSARKGWYSYIKDQVGTIIKVYKHETKQMINTRTYDTFGNLVNQTGSSSGKMGFQSKYYDLESGLNYFYHRYYYPSIGRFINEDPIGFSSGFNLNVFVVNNSINYSDPTGLKIKCEPISEWFPEPGLFFENAQNKPELIFAYNTVDVYQFSKENNPLPIPSVSSIQPPKGQGGAQLFWECKYTLINRYLVGLYKKLEFFNRILECNDDCTGETWKTTERKLDYFYFKGQQNIENIPYEIKTIYQWFPCMPIYIKYN